MTRDITKYKRVKIFEKVGKNTELFVRFPTVAGEPGLPTPSVLSRALP